MRYPAYPDYQNSDVSWLGEIPSHWEVRRLKFMAEVCNGQDQKAVLDDEGSYLVFGSGGPFGKATAFLYDQPSVLLGRKGTIDKPLYVEEPFWTVDTMFYTRIAMDVPPKYFFYLAQTIPFDYFSDLTTLPSMTQSDLGCVPFAFADPKEQRQIAAFLDWKTGQIDTLIAKKKELLEKLKEKRLAVITQAVTKGLNPAAPLHDSGIPWLGQVPKHWEIRCLKFCFDSLNNRRIPLSAEERANMSREYPYYGASGVIDYVEEYIFDEQLILIAEDGANLLSRSTPLAFEARGKYWVNNHAHILRPTLGPFAYWSNLLCIVQYEPWITGAAQPKLTKENLGAIPLPCPPRDEQEAIATFIEKQTGRIDPLINFAMETIARLTEYRTALISAATTGKIDVRNVIIGTVA